jgi:hypothetical protein
MREHGGQNNVVQCCKFIRKLLTTLCVASDHKLGEVGSIKSKATGVGEGVALTGVRN